MWSLKPTITLSQSTYSRYYKYIRQFDSKNATCKTYLYIVTVISCDPKFPNISTIVGNHQSNMIYRILDMNIAPSNSTLSSRIPVIIVSQENDCFSVSHCRWVCFCCFISNESQQLQNESDCLVQNSREC